MTRLVRLLRSHAFVALADQGLWSLGTFLFTAASLAALDTGHFAAISTAAIIGFIGVLIARSWGTAGQVVFATRDGDEPVNAVDRRLAFVGTLIVAGVAWGCSALFLAMREEAATSVWYPLLAAALVLADIPRQILLIESQHLRSFVISLLQVVPAVVVMGLVALKQPVGSIVEIWVVCMLAIAVISVPLVPRRRARARRPDALGFLTRFTAETFYAALAAQLALLLLYGLGDDRATAGVRVASSLVFGPAQVLLQGLQPIFLRVVGTEVANRTPAARGLLVRSAWLVVIVLVGVGSVCLAGLALLNPEAFKLTLPYAGPVAAILVSASLLEFGLFVLRLRYSPSALHRLRIGVVSFDIGLQAAAAAVAGVIGLLVALVVIAAVEVVFVAAVLARADTFMRSPE